MAYKIKNNFAYVLFFVSLIILIIFGVYVVSMFKIDTKYKTVFL